MNLHAQTPETVQKLNGQIWNQTLRTEIKRTRQESKQIIILVILLEHLTVVYQQVVCV